MLKSDAWRDRRVAVMAALGVVSGVLCGFSYTLDDTWRELSVGLDFGLIIGAFALCVALGFPRGRPGK